MVVGSDDTLTVWVNGKQVYDFADRRGFSHDARAVRGDIASRDQPHLDSLRQPGRAVAVLGRRHGCGRLRLPEGSRRRDGFDPEAYRAVALKGQGRREPGPAVIQRPEGPGVRQVPRRGQGRGRGRAGAVDRGGQVSPRRVDRLGAVSVRQDLVGLRADDVRPGRRPRGHRHRPQRDRDAVEIQDAEAKLVRLAKDQIDERKRSDVSLMPNGLAKGLSPQDFADLIAYLETLKNRQVSRASSASQSGDRRSWSTSAPDRDLPRVRGTSIGSRTHRIRRLSPTGRRQPVTPRWMWGVVAALLRDAPARLG